MKKYGNVLVFDDGDMTNAFSIEEGGLKIGVFGLSAYSRYVEEISSKTEAANAAVEGIDLIVDGHSHTLLETGTMIGDTLVVQAGEHLEYIGIVKLYVRDNEVISMEASVIPKEGS